MFTIRVVWTHYNRAFTLLFTCGSTGKMIQGLIPILNGELLTQRSWTLEHNTGKFVPFELT